MDAALPNILVIDDNERLFGSLAVNLKKKGFNPVWAWNEEKALESFAAAPFAAVLLDLALGAESGLDVLPKLLDMHPGVPVIIITGFGTLEAAVKAIKLGAFDFLPKPLDIKKLFSVLREAMSKSSFEDGRTAPRHAFNMVCESPAMQAIRQQALVVADSNLPVLVTGESGTGKEVLAHFLHANSKRRDKPFVSLNCSAIADSLADSELFGHAKGAFTGAESDRAGFFEQTDGGTLHLDGIGDMSPAIQAKILRVLEDAKVRRVGLNRDVVVDVRLIASTNKNLDECIREGTFRQDLFYRLNAAHLRLPPLRKRVEDVPFLLEYFLESQSEGGTVRMFSAQAVEILKNGTSGFRRAGATRKT